MTKLQFNQTLTVEQFKAEMQVDRVDVKRNPHTGKLFFTFGDAVGAVASAGIPEKPVISNVTGSEGANFWLLHEESQGAPTLASF